jgi:hypothetical protein
LWGLGGEVRDGEEARGLYIGSLRRFGGGGISPRRPSGDSAGRGRSDRFPSEVTARA